MHDNTLGVCLDRGDIALTISGESSLDIPDFAFFAHDTPGVFGTDDSGSLRH
jgi:hypothetical protein